MATITILPEAAAQAGCNITTDIVASGAWPTYPDAYTTFTGSYTQKSITADFAGLWDWCEIVVTNRNHGIYKEKRGGGQEGYIETTYDKTATYAISLYKDGGETFTPRAITADDTAQLGPIEFYAGLMAEGSYSWVWDGDLVLCDGEVEIVSIVATFYKYIPAGPILCNRAGEMICNQSGELLYHTAT